MPVAKLNRRTLDATVAGARAVMLYDDALPGFGVRIAPSGAKSFFVEYRPRGVSDKRRLVIGSAAVFSPEQARIEARQLLGRVALGEDPSADRRRNRETLTFENVARAFLDEADEIAKARPLEAKLRPRSIANYRSYLKRHVAPAIGRVKIDRVTQADVAKLHARIGKTRPSTANRAVEFIGSTFRYAATHGFVQQGTNPARGNAAFKELRRERFLSTAELGRLGEAIRDGEQTGLPWEINEDKKTKHVPKNNRLTKLDAHSAAALRLLIFTGARLREILHARWADADFERGILIVEGKTGRRPVILPPPAVAVLDTLPRVSEYIFPGQNLDRPREGLTRAWEAVRRRAGFVGVRLHDLRHSFASVAVAGGASLPIIGRLLGHTQPGTTQRYSHLGDDPLRAAAERAAGTIAAALERRATLTVVPISKRAG